MSVLRKHFLPLRECLLCHHTLYHATQRNSVINSEENEKRSGLVEVQYFISVFVQHMYAACTTCLTDTIRSTVNPCSSIRPKHHQGVPSAADPPISRANLSRTQPSLREQVVCGDLNIIRMINFFSFIVFATVIGRICGISLWEIAVDVHCGLAQVELSAGAACADSVGGQRYRVACRIL